MTNEDFGAAMTKEGFAFGHDSNTSTKPIFSSVRCFWIAQCSSRESARLAPALRWAQSRPLVVPVNRRVTGGAARRSPDAHHAIGCGRMRSSYRREASYSFGPIVR
jgi:hypothetical protein